MEVRLSREMRLLDITMIGVGAMIGAGIFVLTGIAAGVAGPALLVAFLLNGVVALLTAMAYAELGSAFHDAGGGYLWVKTALPGPNGFLSGWMSWFAHAVACSLYALGFGAYAHLVLGAVGVSTGSFAGLGMEKWLAILVCVLFAWINYRGAAETGKAGNVVTVAKIAVIGVFVAAGLAVMVRRPAWNAAFTPFLSNGWGGVFAAMGLTFIAFEGYEIIAQTSEEVEDPRRNVPRATFLSLLIVVPIYLLVAIVAIGAVQPPAGVAVSAYLGQQKELALVSAADQFVRGGGIVILVGGLLSTVSALNATIYSSSRVAFAMARDENLPTPVGRVHPRRATPHVAILVSALLIILMATALPIEEVAAAADIMFLFLFAQVNVAAIRLRRLRPDLPRGFRIPLVPVLPLLAVGTTLFLAYFLVRHYPVGSVAAMAWLIAGGGLYYGYARHREAAVEERERWMERLERGEYRVLAAVSSPRTMPALMEAAIALAAPHSGEVVALSVAEVPEGEALLAGRARARALEPVLLEAVRFAEERGARARPVLKLARRVSQGIVETAREESCNFLLLGRPVADSFLERVVASIVESVLRRAPCQVGIVYGAIAPGRVTGIAVPVSEGANPKLAAVLAPALAGHLGVPVRALTIVPPELAPADAERLVDERRTAAAAAGLRVPVEVFRASEVVRGLLTALRPGELVVIGAPSTDPVAALLGDTVPGAIAAARRNPLIVVRDLPAVTGGRFHRFFRERRGPSHDPAIGAAAH